MKNDENETSHREVSPTASCSALDVCCGSRMMWFAKDDERGVFVDKRSEKYRTPDSSSSGGYRDIDVSPDIVANFCDLPFDDSSYPLVVFDPPHLKRAGDKSWMAKKYGKLEGDWKSELRKGFDECWRVLRPEGTLIFKWNETQIPVSQIMPLAPARPLFVQRCGKTAKTHWMVFLKPSSAA